ncbi:LruC domain-containing protein [Bacteroides cellulosilyticus]|uniref:LruC domain-containing protein n=1 Tax=Bacteroides cellulosilyticus TaxID=246787 RepID=UPI00189F4C77|nr:LruC domain-containing protein [Bacteroides cellulosilyticus]
MKLINRLSVMATVVSTMFLASCADDVYDPSKEPQVTPTENPLGEGFNAPDGFNWSMINTVNLNVEVKDAFNGKYQYAIEVFTSNPLADETATPIAAGPAKQSANYIAEVNIPKTVEFLYIRQTDPNQRKEVYAYAVPENGGSLNCKLYYTATTSRAVTRASSVGTSGWDNVTDPGYTEETYNVPSESASIINGNQLPNGSTYIIKPGETLSQVLHSYNGANATVYIQGTWNVNGNITPQGIDIIVLNGGKITSTSGTFMVSDKSSLTVQSGGEVNCNIFSTATNVVIKNFGTIKTKEVSGQNGLNTGTVLYNASDALFQVEDKFIITSSQIYNHGTISLTAENAYMQANKTSAACLIANYEKATIKGNRIQAGATIVNSGTIEVNILENSSTDFLYNNCLLIVKNTFKFRNVVLDQASITGGRTNPSDKEWLPVPLVESLNSAQYTLIDGSMIKAKEFKVQSGSQVTFKAINKAKEDRSMIKAENIYFEWHTYVQGNMVLEGKQYNPERSHIDASVASTGYDESKYTIETCGGIFNEGNEGEDPYTPEIPVVDDATTYTYVFEDNWPKYGDFDLNDIVLTLNNRSTQANSNGNLKSAQFDITLEAVGASKIVGVGIRFLGLPASVTPNTFTIKGNNASFEAGQSLPTLILFESAHTEFGFTDRPFINTYQTASTNKADLPQYAVRFEFTESDKISSSAFNINNLDVFIITKAADQRTKRTEVHIAGYAPTDLANTTLFGQANDDSSLSSKRYYLSSENLTWGIVVPDKFSWPLEIKNVKDVYTEFANWVTSGGKENKDWYKNHNGQVFKK